MQVASRQPIWQETGGGGGTVLTMRFTEATGLYVNFWIDALPDAEPVAIWGDGTKETLPRGHSGWWPHTFASYGECKVRVKNSSFVGFTVWDSSSYRWSDALVSIVDKGGTYNSARSGAYKNCRNLETVILTAPGVGMGQRPFAGCTSLKKVSIPGGSYFYDGTFENCPLLEKLEFRNADTLWYSIFSGCGRLREIDLGNVYQIAGGALSGAPALTDVRVSNLTVGQLTQSERIGNINGGPFPFGAGPNVRFHCTDGIVLGNGTRI